MEEKKEIELTQSDFEKTKKAEKVHSGTGLKVVCGLLALATLGLGGFIVYDKFFATQSEKVETSVSNQTLVEEKDKVAENNTYIYNTDEQELYDLFAKYIHDISCGNGLEFGAQYNEGDPIFMSRSFNLDDMSKADVAWVIFWEAVYKHESFESYNNEFNAYLSKDELETIKNKLFGKKYNFDVATMHTLADEWNWDSKKEVLYFKSGWGGVCPNPSVNTKIVKAEKTNQNIEIFVRRLGRDNRGFYKYQNGQKQYFGKELSDYATSNGNDYVLTVSDWRKGNLYKVTFEQDPDDSKNYIFKSSEILE